MKTEEVICLVLDENGEEAEQDYNSVCLIAPDNKMFVVGELVEEGVLDTVVLYPS